MAVARRRFAGEGLAVRDPDLQLDEIDAVHELRHWMLDLDPAVELEEVDVAAVNEELGGARAPISDCRRECSCRLFEPAADPG